MSRWGILFPAMTFILYVLFLFSFFFCEHTGMVSSLIALPFHVLIFLTLTSVVSILGKIKTELGFYVLTTAVNPLDLILQSLMKDEKKGTMNEVVFKRWIGWIMNGNWFLICDSFKWIYRALHCSIYSVTKFIYFGSKPPETLFIILLASNFYQHCSRHQEFNVHRFICYLLI